MKKPCFILLLVLSFYAQAQNFSDKTNTIVVSYKQEVTPSTLPVITWTTPRVETTLSTQTGVDIHAEVRTDLPLRELKVIRISGESRSEKDLPFTQNESTVVIRQRIALLDGESTIMLMAVNTSGGRVESSRKIIVGKDALAEKLLDANRRDYALVFATDKYDHWDDLSNPLTDAHTIAGILEDKYGFVTEVVENPSLEDITGKLFDYNTKKFNPQDQLFVFFAGHGHFDETVGMGYVVASNSLKDDKGKSTYLAHAIIRENLDNIKCEHIFLAMDVCFGGTFDKKLARGTVRGESISTVEINYLVSKIAKRTRKFLTSGGKEYVPDGEPGHHSPFATQFIRALKEIGGSQRRVLSLVELPPYFLTLSTQPYFGSFGTDDPQSDFVFIAK